MTPVKNFLQNRFLSNYTQLAVIRIFISFLQNNLYQRGNFSVTICENTTHLVLLESLPQGKQLRILRSELDGITANFLKYCYMASTRKLFGHSLIDLRPSCPDIMRFCTNITSERLSLPKKKATPKKNSLNISFFANKLYPDSHFFSGKKVAQIQSNKKVFTSS